jgi:hypothetical protein
MKASMNDQPKKTRKKKVSLPSNEEMETAKEITKVQRLSIPTGNKLWEVDLKTQEIREAEVTIVEGNKSAFKKDNCLYIVALNPKNVMRKLSNKLAEFKKSRTI